LGTIDNIVVPTSIFVINERHNKYLADKRLTNYYQNCIITSNMDNLIERVSRAVENIAAIKSKQARVDLLKMIKNVDHELNNLNKESVECRRLKRETAKYQEIKKQATKMLEDVESYITFAVLLG